MKNSRLRKFIEENKGNFVSGKSRSGRKRVITAPPSLPNEVYSLKNLFAEKRMKGPSSNPNEVYSLSDIFAERSCPEGKRPKNVRGYSYVSKRTGKIHKIGAYTRCIRTKR